MSGAAVSAEKQTLSSIAGEGVKWHSRSESDLPIVSINLKAYKFNKSMPGIPVYISYDKYLLINYKERKRTWRMKGNGKGKKEERKKEEEE